ncbi:hypothetical protein FB567DRAFT_612647 [Paraphoma chrysanthemicola]|uniref:Uncharacterized protein n=1 Tax=Paraphoma chrysanthemicola TaxID=798071 RepID=A0A8K0QU54_9PLEO|nr:hypothetical protein FB567DRAFT_612647 [Paraphoma chrysanthemicola]
MLHFLFDVSSNQLPAWYPRPYSSARVLQVTYDYMTQTIRLGPPRDALVMQSATARTSSAMMQRMQALGLQNVGGTSKDLQSAGGAGGRARCDLCMCHRFGSTLLVEKCIKVGNSNICTNCQMLGLPCCSFTPGLVGIGKVEQHADAPDPPSVDEVKLSRKIKRILYVQDLDEAKNNAGSYKQHLIKLQIDEKADDSDEEKDEADDEIDDDDI